MRKPRGYWDYEHCYEEAKRYSCRSEFKRENFKAYHIANINDWLGDYDWFTRPNKKWNYQNCLEESKKYTSRSEFAQNSSGAYHVASRNGWLKDYTWLPEDGRSLKLEQYGIWTKEACFKEAQKYKTRTEFARKNNSAYNSARGHNWIEDYTWLRDERLDLVDGKVDCVYAYEFVDERTVYVGRTLIKRKKDRDREHLYVRNDAVVKFAVKHDIEVPEPKYLEENLTIQEGVDRENYWINKYKEEGWKVLNKAKAGSIGGLGKGKTKFTYAICFEEAKKWTTRTEFRNCGNNAYRVALKNDWIKDYTWFLDGQFVGAAKRRKYDRKICFEEAKKYKTISEFEKGSHGACVAARTHGWMKDYTWFTILWQEKWNKETCYNEAKKYSSLEEFRTLSGSAYATACAKKWLEDYDWLERKRIKRGFWQNYDNCYNEAKKYKKLTNFMRKSSGAYASALKKGWLKDYTWFKDKGQLDLFNQL